LGVSLRKKGEGGKEIGPVFKVFWKVSPELELRSKEEAFYLAGAPQLLP
jgi:hypothetical protein